MRNKRLTLLFFSPILLFTLFAGCSKNNSPSGEESSSRVFPSDRVINVLVTTGMIADMVQNIGQERVNVTALMGPGVDPHLYKASEGDVSRMLNADAIFYNGLHLEGKMTELFEQMERKKLTFAITRAIDETKLISPPGFEGAHDPHIWFDVSLWMDATTFVKNTFIQYDPGHKDFYEKNYARFYQKLTELNTYVKEQAALLETNRRVLITAHDAFNYFGKAYGFKVLGLQGISTASEAGTADVKELADFIVKRKVPAIFVETSVSDRSVKALQESVQAKGFNVVIGGNLYSDSMGSAGTPDSTYIGMVKHNINTIVQSLSDKKEE